MFYRIIEERHDSVQAKKAANDERQVEVYAMFQDKSENRILLVEWTVLRKAKARKKRWGVKGFQELSSQTLTIQNDHIYKVKTLIYLPQVRWNCYIFI